MASMISPWGSVLSGPLLIVEQYKRIVFRSYLCGIHANSHDILSIRYL